MISTIFCIVGGAILGTYLYDVGNGDSGPGKVVAIIIGIVFVILGFVTNGH